MSSKKAVEEVVPDATPDERGKIPAAAFLWSLKKHQDGVRAETATRNDLHKSLVIASFPKWGDKAEPAKKDGH